MAKDISGFDEVKPSSAPVDFTLFNSEPLEKVEMDSFLLGDIQDVKPKEEVEIKEEEKIETTDSMDDFIVGEKPEVEAPIVETPKEEEQPEEPQEEINIFTGISETLFSEGVFSEEDGEEPIDTPEKLLAKFQKEKQLGAFQFLNNYLGQFGQKHRDAFAAIYEQGVDPEVYFKGESKLESVKNLDLTQESVQEQVIRELFRKEGRKEASINRAIESFRDTGKLEEEAQDAHETLLFKEEQEFQKNVQEQAQYRQQMQQAKQYEKQSLYNILQDKHKQKEFDGIPLTEKTFNEISDYLLTDRYQNEVTGETFSKFDNDLMELKKPENYELKVKLAMLLKNKLDLTKVKTAAVSQKNNQLFNQLVQKEKDEKRKNPLNKSTKFLS